MRFSRQIALRELGDKGHGTLRRARVLLIGCGATGTWSAMLLGSLGIGRAIIVDRDLVDESNLSHQPVYTEEDIGMPKARAAAARLHAMFPATRWEAIDAEADAITLARCSAQIILDCTDNMDARRTINEWCVKNKKPWVYSAAVGTTGMVHAFLPGKPCFACAFYNRYAEDTCQTRGILNPLAAAIASAQMSEAVKVLTGKKPGDALIRVDAWRQDVEKIRFSRRKNCPVCVQKRFDNLRPRPTGFMEFCGGGVYQARLAPRRTQGLRRHAKKQWRGGFTIGALTIFDDGRILIKAKNEKEARAALHKVVGS